jgi:palmitoyltransferase ZDHHC2/15/20
MDFKAFLKDVLRLVKFSMYPLLELYGYFVFLGIFCLEDKTFSTWVVLLFFIVYHFLATTKIIFYMQLMKSKNPKLTIFQT